MDKKKLKALENLILSAGERNRSMVEMLSNSIEVFPFAWPGIHDEILQGSQETFEEMEV